MSAQELLNSSDEQLKAFAMRAPAEQLEEVFRNIWTEIRAAHHYPGQPRNRESSRSVDLAKVALQLATHSGDKTRLLESWHMTAHAFMADEQYQNAIPFYDKRIEYLEETGDYAQAARARQGHVLALMHAGRNSDALKSGLTAEQWFRENGDQLNYAKTCTNLGNVFNRMDDNVRAHRYYCTAAEIFKAMDEIPALAEVYMNLGATLSNLDRFEESDEMYARSIALGEQVNMTELCTQASYNRAFLSYLRGRYSEALQAFSSLRESFQASGSDRYYALCDLDEAEIYLQLNLSKDAAALAIRAAEQFKKIGFRYEQAKAIAFYGVAMIQLRRFADALEAFRVSQEIYEQEGNVYWIGLLDLYRAEVHLSLQRFWEAQALATNAKKDIRAALDAVETHFQPGPAWTGSNGAE